MVNTSRLVTSILWFILATYGSAKAGSVAVHMSGGALYAASEGAKGHDLHSLFLEDTEYLFREALSWDRVDPQKGLDTMRLFVERYPHYQGNNCIPRALNWTGTFTYELGLVDDKWDLPRFIEEYNWLASIYPLDTSAVYRSDVLAAMADNEVFFDRNEACNLWQNIYDLFPPYREAAEGWMEEIRYHQSRIPEDTTPFYTMTLPPRKYGTQVVAAPRSETLKLVVSPNPTHGEFAAELQVADACYIELSVCDALGRTVWNSGKRYVQEGLTDVPINLGSEPNGSYFLRLSTDYATRTVPVIVRR